MTTHNQNRYNKAINQMSEMSNFGVLPNPTPPARPPASSATPGPPPFQITRTPLFVHRSPYYDIHPATLRDMNGSPNDFDIEHSAPIEDREGYPRPPQAYNNYVDGHLTHVTIPPSKPIHMDIGIGFELDSKPIQKPSADTKQTREQPSPSLLHGSSPAMPKKPPGVSHYQSIVPMDDEGRLYAHEPSWFSDLSAALNRMGINQTTTLLLLLAVFIAVQFNLFNNHRNVRRTGATSSNPLPDDPSYITEDKMHLLLQKQQAEFDQKLNEKMQSIHNNTTDLHEQVMRNTADIGVNKANISYAKDEIVQNAERTDEIEHDLQSKADMAAVQDTLDWYEDQTTTNWISGIVDMPQIIPLIEDDDSDKKQADFNLFDPFAAARKVKRGIEKYHEEVKGSSPDDDMKQQLKNTANIDITDAATPYTLRPMDCLQFNVQKEDRFMEFSLIERIIPSEFVYIHVRKEELRMEDRLKSPKRFMLFGKVKGGDWMDIAVKEDKILGINESVIKLTLDTETGIDMMRVEYDVNQEAKQTRIYRMKVHGTPDVNG
eukprot:190031_1